MVKDSTMATTCTNAFKNESGSDGSSPFGQVVKMMKEAMEMM